MRVNVLKARHDEEIAVVEHRIARSDRRSVACRADIGYLATFTERKRMVFQSGRIISCEQRTAAHMRRHWLTPAATLMSRGRRAARSAASTAARSVQRRVPVFVHAENGDGTQRTACRHVECRRKRIPGNLHKPCGDERREAAEQYRGKAVIHRGCRVAHASRKTSRLKSRESCLCTSTGTPHSMPVQAEVNACDLPWIASRNNG